MIPVTYKYSLFAFLGTLFFLASCRTDFDISGDYQEIAVVHFLLDPNDNQHFLKINKTFSGEGDATVFAKVADSSYFDEVEAIVEEVIGGNLVSGEILGGSVNRQWLLKDTIIDNKQPGAFYYPEQKLYYFNADDLNTNALYRLKITVDGGKHNIAGATALVSGINLTTPNPNTPLNFAEANVPVNGYRNQPIRFSKGTGAIYDVKLLFRYREFTAAGSEVKELRWNLGEVIASEVVSPNVSVIANGETFYDFLGNNIPENPDVTRRQVENVEIVVTGGSSDLLTYILVNQPSSSIAQNKPEFTNLAGAMGIFSSRTTVTQFKAAFNPIQPNQRALSVNSTRELARGFYTFFLRDLKFCSNIPSDIGQGYNFACD